MLDLVRRDRHRHQPGRHRPARLRLLLGRDRLPARHHPPGRPATLGPPLMTAATAALSPEPSPGPGPGATADDTETISWADFRAWERQLATSGHCSHPIRLRGRIDAIDLTTGETAPVYDTADRARGSAARRLRQPPRGGLPGLLGGVQARRPPARPRGPGGGKGIPETITAHPCVFATLTAPSFGPVHSRRMRGKTVLPCRPRRDAHARRCPHGRDISCPTRHVEDDPRLGQPMCGDCYDYDAAVLFNAYAGDLWRRFTTYLPRHLARLAGVTGKELRAAAPHPVRQGGRVPGTRRRPLPRRDPPRRPRRGLPAPARPVHRRPAVRRHRPGRRRRPRPRRPRRKPTRPAPFRHADRHPAHPPRHDRGHRPAARRPGRGQLHRQVRHQDPDRPRPA